MNTTTFVLRLAIFAGLLAPPFLAHAISWQATNFEQGRLQAAQQDKLMLLYFAADWCVPCQWMDAHTFDQPELAAYVQQHYIAIKVDLHKVETKRLQHRFEVDVVPSFLVFDASGRLIGQQTGSMDMTVLMGWLKQLDIPAHHIRPQATTAPIAMVNIADAPTVQLEFSVPPLFTEPSDEPALSYISNQKHLLVLADEPLAMNSDVQLFGRSTLTYGVELSEFAPDYEMAVRTVAEMERKHGQPADLHPHSGGTYRIVMGKFPTTGDANRFLQYLMRNNKQGTVIPNTR